MSAGGMSGRGEPAARPSVRALDHGHDAAVEGHAHQDHAGHDHSHHRDIGQRRLLVVLAITATFMVAEFVGGWLSNSLALMADAGHMLSDVAALGLSIFALGIARRPATQEKTYGYLRTEILAALINGVTLVVIAAAIIWQAWGRFFNPEPVEGGLMLVVAAAGLLSNVVAAVLLHASSGHNLNVRGAYLHVLGDLLGSVGAIIAAVVILLTGWLPADPLISFVVALLILAGSWRLIRESVDILLEAVPKHIDMEEVRRTISEIPGVDAVHDLHVWALTSGFLAMSGHALIREPSRHRPILLEIHARMHDDFGISHVTVQIEHHTMYNIARPDSDERSAP
jgi:cobalt-zinc-cadmium efflux system protein